VSLLQSCRHPAPGGGRWQVLLFFVLAWLVLLPAGAAQETDQRLHVYVREGCPHCADAKAFLPQFLRTRPHLELVVHQVDADPAAADALSRLFQQAGQWPPGVPTFVYRGRMLVGFADSATTGQALAALLDEAPPLAPPVAAAPPPGRVEAGPLGELSVARLGLPMFTLAIGLIDGFNPCAMWVLLFLLSLLVHLKDRKRMLLIAASFVLVSAAVYYAFLAAWLNLFLAVGLSSPVRTGLALLALVIAAINLRDALHPGHGFTLSIPETAKPGLYARMRSIVQARSLPLAMLGAAALAVLVNLVELLCTAGLPAMYSAVLAQQQLGDTAHHAYLVLYILGYIADDSIMVGGAVLALSSGKLTAESGRWLKLLSGLVMLVLGAVMLTRPEWLS
jgi:glutaredoxin